jgi:hypothetical protein
MVFTPPRGIFDILQETFWGPITTYTWSPLCMTSSSAKIEERVFCGMSKKKHASCHKKEK